MARIALFRIGRPAPNAAVYSRVEVDCLSRRPPLLDRLHRPTAGRTLPTVGRTLYLAAMLSGAGTLRADLRRRGERDLDEFFTTELAARGRRAVQGRKVEQGDFERDVAFEYFSRMPPGELANQLAVGGSLDRIARIIVAAPRGRRSFKETRRRVGKLRKEFLRLRA